MPNTPSAEDPRDVDAAPLVSYQGVPGAFGESAVHRAFRDRVHPYPTPTFHAALEALCSGVVSRAVIPVWNSSTGPVMYGRRALEAYRPWIERVDEVEIPVTLCLIAHAGTSLSDIRFVGSHPTALAQCKKFFASHGAQPCHAFNTAGAVRELAEYEPTRTETWYAQLGVSSRHELAAIASERAAHQYGLTVLQSNIHDDPTNRTRFVVVRARPAASRAS